MEFVQKNKWKLLFFSLLIVNILVLSVIGYRTLKPLQEQFDEQTTQKEEEKETTFLVHASKNELNSLINNYLKDSLENSHYHFEVQLKDRVQIQGQLPFLGFTIPIYIELDPLIDGDGNLILRQKEIRFGDIDLPNKYALQYIGNTVDLPDFIQIRAETEEIYIHMEQMQRKEAFHLSLRTIDLQKDEISIEINVSTQN